MTRAYDVFCRGLQEILSGRSWRWRALLGLASCVGTIGDGERSPVTGPGRQPVTRDPRPQREAPARRP